MAGEDMIQSTRHQGSQQVYSFEFTVQYSQIPLYGHPLRTLPCYYAQFALSVGKERPYIFSNFNPFNMDILLISTLSIAPPSVRTLGLQPRDKAAMLVCWRSVQ